MIKDPFFLYVAFTVPHAGGWASAPAANEAGAPVPTDVPYVKTGANWSVYYYHALTECFIFSSSHLFIYVFTILSCRFSCILFFTYIYILWSIYIYIYSKEIIISSLLLKTFYVLFFSRSNGARSVTSAPSPCRCAMRSSGRPSKETTQLSK